MYHLLLVLCDHGQLPEEAEGDDEQVEVVSLEAAGEDLDQSGLAHLLLDGRVVADVVEDVEADEEQLVLLPDQHVQLLQLRLRCDSIIFVVAPPHFDILAVKQVKALDLVLEHFYDGGAHFVLSEQILELLVIGQNVEHAEDVDGEVDVALVVFGERPAEHGQQRIWVVRHVPCSSRLSRFPKSWNS